MVKAVLVVKIQYVSWGLQAYLINSKKPRITIENTKDKKKKKTIRGPRGLGSLGSFQDKISEAKNPTRATRST
ncbi:hypothetical protein, partial [Rathayibacter toxicus]|uniref:hypothetical protein n=1 Tax=Rathayibacter toxicus TaxID=145458 RepID=UPI001C112955